MENVELIPLPEVKRHTGLGRTKIYSLINSKEFPAPIKLSPRASRWVKSEVLSWVHQRIRDSRNAPQ